MDVGRRSIPPPLHPSLPFWKNIPHCIIEYAKKVEISLSPAKLMGAVKRGTFDSGLFREKDIKTRIIPFEYYQVGDTDLEFIHVTESFKAFLSDFAALRELERIVFQKCHVTSPVFTFDTIIKKDAGVDRKTKCPKHDLTKKLPAQVEPEVFYLATQDKSCVAIRLQ